MHQGIPNLSHFQPRPSILPWQMNKTFIGFIPLPPNSLDCPTYADLCVLFNDYALLHKKCELGITWHMLV